MSSIPNVDEVPWAHLPITVLTKIFNYLSQGDRLNACIVCRSWEIAFHSPGLWNTARINFNRKCPTVEEALFRVYLNSVLKFKMIPEFWNYQALLFAKEKGLYLRDLRLKFLVGSDKMMDVEGSNLISTLERFLNQLDDSECELRNLDVYCDWYSCNWKTELKEIFTQILTRFLSNQTHLKVVQFNCWFKYCERLLESLVEGSGSSLQSLKFSVEDKLTSFNQTTRERFYSLFAKMTNLEKLEVPFECMNCLVLGNLLENNSVLNSITLSCSSIALEVILRAKIGISSNQWKTALKKHPKLQVTITDYCVRTFSLVPLALPFFMPLVSLQIDVDTGMSDNDWNDEAFFTYLKDGFSETLEIFHYCDLRRSITLELTTQIKQFLIDCPKINDLSLYIFKEMSMKYIEDICEMQMQKKIDLQNLYIRYQSNKSEDELEFNKILEKHKEQLGKRNWKLHFVHQNFSDEEMNVYPT